MSDDEQERKRKTPLKVMANRAQNRHIHGQNGLGHVGFERKRKKSRRCSVLESNGNVEDDALGSMGGSSPSASQNPLSKKEKAPEMAASLQEQRKQLPIAKGV